MWGSANFAKYFYQSAIFFRLFTAPGEIEWGAKTSARYGGASNIAIYSEYCRIVLNFGESFSNFASCRALSNPDKSSQLPPKMSRYCQTLSNLATYRAILPNRAKSIQNSPNRTKSGQPPPNLGESWQVAAKRVGYRRGDFYDIPDLFEIKYLRFIS